MSKSKHILIFIFFIILGVTTLTTCGNKSKTDTNIPEEYFVTAPNAELYYENNSEVISIIDVNASNNVLTEAETSDLLISCGFTQFPITSYYSMDGKYYDAENIDSTGTGKHPIYETYYITSNGDIWTIFIINDSIIANPVSYNLQSKTMIQVMISESDTITSYDGTTNKFFLTIPNPSSVLIITVEKINVALLETLTVEEIDRYVY